MAKLEVLRLDDTKVRVSTIVLLAALVVRNEIAHSAIMF